MRPIGFFAVFAILFLAISCKPKTTRQESPKSEEPAANDIPAVILIEESGREFSAKELKGNSILVFFGAGCDHCQREATAIHDNLESFKGYKLYFISMDPFPVIHQFAKDYGIDGQPNILFMRADGGSVNSVLGYLDTPTIFVYDSGRRLIKRFDGETKVGEIIKVL